jgi:hypothetical protein
LFSVLTNWNILKFSLGSKGHSSTYQGGNKRWAIRTKETGKGRTGCI